MQEDYLFDGGDPPCCSKAGRPALEHERDCHVRVTFFGGKVHWDRTKKQRKDEVVYCWNESLGTWLVDIAESL